MRSGGRGESGGLFKEERRDGVGELLGLLPSSSDRVGVENEEDDEEDVAAVPGSGERGV